MEKVDKRKTLTPAKLEQLKAMREKAAEKKREKKEQEQQEQEEQAKEQVLNSLTEESPVLIQKKQTKKKPVQVVQEESEDESEYSEEPEVEVVKVKKQTKKKPVVENEDLKDIIRQTIQESLYPQETPSQKKERKMEEFYQYTLSRNGSQKSFVEPQKKKTQSILSLY